MNRIAKFCTPDALRTRCCDRPVATASSAQVRRPIYASSVGRWKHYEPYLADLIAALDAPP